MRKLATLGLSLSFGATLLLGQVQVGAKVTDFNLRDTSGQSVAFAALRGGTTVVTFVSTQCPISNDYNDRMNALYSEYSAKGVKFVFINPNATESAADVVAHAQKVNFAFPVYKDENNVVADQLGAQFTPESFVFDQSGTLRYHGHIDDSRNASRIQFQGLRVALDAMLAGQAVERSDTKAFGCTIKRVKK